MGTFGSLGSGRVTGAAREELARHVAERYAHGLSLREVTEEFGFSDRKVAALMSMVDAPRRSPGGASVSNTTRSQAHPLSTWYPLDHDPDLEDRLTFNLNALTRVGLGNRHPGRIRGRGGMER
jgi:hypothetical protein